MSTHEGPERALSAYWRLRDFPPVRSRFTVDEAVDVAMRDGIRLKTDLYRPTTSGPAPPSWSGRRTVAQLAPKDPTSR